MLLAKIFAVHFYQAVGAVQLAAVDAGSFGHAAAVYVAIHFNHLIPFTYISLDVS